MARIVVVAAVVTLAACGTRTTPVAEPVPSGGERAAEPSAPPSVVTAPPDETAERAQQQAPEPAAPVVADTPMCRAFKKVVESAGRGFSGLTPKPKKEAEQAPEPFALPGAERCVIIAGGPGHSATATYTCEFGTAEAGTKLAGKRDQLASQIRSCGSKRALAATRVRLVDAAGKQTLVVNVHDHARW